MVKTFYIQKNEEDIITDILEFPHMDYISIQLNTPIPTRIISGCYRLINGEPIYVPVLDRDFLVDEISLLKEKNVQLEQQVNQLTSALREVLLPEHPELLI